MHIKECICYIFENGKKFRVGGWPDFKNIKKSFFPIIKSCGWHTVVCHTVITVIQRTASCFVSGGKIYIYTVDIRITRIQITRLFTSSAPKSFVKRTQCKFYKKYSDNAHYSRFASRAMKYTKCAWNDMYQNSKNSTSQPTNTKTNIKTK